MKSLWKIIRRYSVMAGVIVMIILISNAIVLGYLGYQFSIEDEKSYTGNIRVAMESISGKIKKDKDGTYYLTKKGRQVLEKTNFVWAMALNQEGDVIWEWKLPKDIPRKYSLNDVAVFSRWYLCDYPVRVWKQKDILTVYGYPKNSFAVIPGFYSIAAIQNFPKYIKVFLFANLVVILLFILLFGYRFYRELRPISYGIEALSKKQPIRLRERGVVGDLAKKINTTSKLLEEQDRKLTLRDRARTDWIAGVSHDIRTPLTLIMGYSERLAKCDVFGEQEREMAKIIERQSVVIRQLIEDLNLTSKLTYNSTPLSLAEHFPAKILRECVTEIYNSGLDEEYEIQVFVPEEAEKRTVSLDEKLLKRAIRNVLGNSIRHNEEGCRIEVRLSVEEGYLRYSFFDSGRGIQEEIVRELTHPGDGKDKARPHIMGLRLVKQIANLHGGDLKFCKRESGTYDSEIWIRL